MFCVRSVKQYLFPLDSSRSFIVWLFIGFAGASYGRLSTYEYVQEPLAIGRRGCAGRGLNGKTLAADKDASSPVWKAVAYESDVSEGVQVTVILIK